MSIFQKITDRATTFITTASKSFLQDLEKGKLYKLEAQLAIKESYIKFLVNELVEVKGLLSIRNAELALIRSEMRRK